MWNGGALKGTWLGNQPARFLAAPAAAPAGPSPRRTTNRLRLECLSSVCRNSVRPIVTPALDIGTEQEHTNASTRLRSHFATASFPPLEKKGKAVAHLASILFFSGLLIALGLALELTIKAYLAEIVAAFRGVPLAAATKPRAPVAWHSRAAA